VTGAFYMAERGELKGHHGFDDFVSEAADFGDLSWLSCDLPRHSCKAATAGAAKTEVGERAHPVGGARKINAHIQVDADNTLLDFEFFA
jgi:hypothetical protein